MSAIAWMVGVSAVSWLVVSLVGGDRVNPEAAFGLAGPLVAVCATWVVVRRVHRSAPERLTAVMIAGFAFKLLFFGAYVAVMLRGLSLRPVPFVAAFVSYLIALYAMEALFLRRLILFHE